MMRQKAELATLALTSYTTRDAIGRVKKEGEVPVVSRSSFPTAHQGMMFMPNIS